MKVSENIKTYRLKLGITQKDLGDKLFVSYQAVSRWENGEVEPSLDTLNKMCEIFNCTLEELVYGESDKEISTPTSDDKKEENSEEKVVEPVQIGTCVECKAPIYKETDLHKVSMNKGGVTSLVTICSNCKRKHNEITAKKDKMVKEMKRLRDENVNGKSKGFLISVTNKQMLIWGIISGLLAFGIALGILLACNYNVGASVGLAFAALYIVFADLYCILQEDCFVADIFFTIAGFSIRMPGIIFSLSLDGIISLILVKIGFGIIGILISIVMFIAAVVICSIISIVAFPFYLIKQLVRR